jgi:hypothetical protein
MAISHAFTNQISDGTNTNIVRPSDWNSAHNQYYTLSGNTLGNSTVSGTNVVFQGSGNVSLSGTGQTIVLYATGGGTQSVQTQASGNIAGAGFTSTTTTGTAIVGTQNSLGLSLGVPAFLTSAGGGGVALAASTQTATSGTVSFANSNGISFGMSGSNQITASYTTSPVSNVTAGNNISLSTAGSTLTINAQAVALAGGTQTATSGTVTFANSNGISFGMSGSNQITASYTVPTAYVSSVNGSSGAISLNVGSSLSSSATGSSITFGLASNITTALQSANANYLTSQSNQAFSASGGSSTFQTLNFANSNGVTFSNSGGSVVASYTVPATTGFAGTGFTSTTITGTAITAALGTDGLSMAIPAYLTTGGGGGVMYANLSGNTSGNTTASGSTLNFSGINVTLSGTNASQIAISAPAVSSLVGVNGISIATTGSTISISNAQFTLSGFNHYNDVVLVAGQAGQGILVFDPMNLANPVQFDRFAQYIANTNSSNSSGSHSISIRIGIYTKNASTLSLFQSTSTSFAVTQSGTAGSYASYSGMRLLTTPFTTTLSANDYWIGVVSSTSSAGGNGNYSMMLQSNLNTNFAGVWNAAMNATMQATLGQGFYSAATAGLPGSVAFSQIQGTNSNVFRPPVIVLVSGTA